MNQERPLPISVIIPTLNAIEELPRHVHGLHAWIGDAAEVIVVDGESEDGSLGYLQRTLEHPQLSFHTRPRGLYAAWNFAVSRASQEFVYFATVGDVMSAEGLRSLYEVATAFDADIVISPPRFIDPDGRPIASEPWPIHRLLRIWPAGPRLLSFWESVALSMMFGAQGILGSSASNLYRARVLQQRPFPVDAGHAGDSLWGYEHAIDVRIAVAPTPCADFVLEREAAGPRQMSDRQAIETVRRFLTAAQDRVVHRPPAEADQSSVNAVRLLLESRLDLLEWIDERVRILDHLRQNNAQQKAYIDELEAHGAARLTIIQTMEADVRQLRMELEQRRDIGLRQQVKRLVRDWTRQAKRVLR